MTNKLETVKEEDLIKRKDGGYRKGLAFLGRKQIDYLSDRHIREAMLKEGYVKTFTQRTAMKKSIRTHTHKKIAKAVANIQAVEKGMFGVGHINDL